MYFKKILKLLQNVAVQHSCQVVYNGSTSLQLVAMKGYSIQTALSTTCVGIDQPREWW